jgi:sugar O-acyltransferase (sialic acid O-acetyltransferase NeuD family)
MPENKKILLIGGGGHCISVLDSLISNYDYASIGIVDKGGSQSINPENTLKSILDIPIVGDDKDLARLHAEGFTDAFITVGSIKDCTIRKKLYQIVKQIGFHIPNIIDKSSVVSPYASIGEGIFIAKNAVINTNVRIGNCAIVNTSSIIEHDCCIADFVHIAPGSILSGNVHVDKDSLIGAGCVIKQGIRIGAGTIIGMGSVVLKDIGDHVIAYGIPCKEVNYE